MNRRNEDGNNTAVANSSFCMSSVHDCAPASRPFPWAGSVLWLQHWFTRNAAPYDHALGALWSRLCQADSTNKINIQDRTGTVIHQSNRQVEQDEAADGEDINQLRDIVLCFANRHRRDVECAWKHHVEVKGVL